MVKYSKIKGILGICTREGYAIYKQGCNPNFLNSRLIAACSCGCSHTTKPHKIFVLISLFFNLA